MNGSVLRILRCKVHIVEVWGEGKKLAHIKVGKGEGGKEVKEWE